MARVTVEDCVEKIPNRFDLVLAAAERAPVDAEPQPKIEEAKTMATEPVQAMPIASPPAVDKETVTLLLNSAASDLANGEIEAVLKIMSDNVRITTADGKIYQGKKSVRKVLNTAMSGTLKNISSKPVIDEVRSFGNGTVAFGRSTDTLSDAVKKPLVLKSHWSATLVLKEGKPVIDSLHHSMNVQNNAIVKEERETFTYVAAAVAGGAAILGFVLGWGL